MRLDRRLKAICATFERLISFILCKRAKLSAGIPAHPEVEGQLKLIALSFVSIFAVPLLAQAHEIVVDGLLRPHKILLVPGGGFLVSETSKEPNSARPSLVSSAGVRRNLFEGLHSGEDVAGDGSGPSALALELDGNTLLSLGFSFYREVFDSFTRQFRDEKRLMILNGLRMKALE